MALTAEQTKTITSSWDALKKCGDVESHGIAMFERLFKANPILYNVFPFANGLSTWEELVAGGKVQHHAGGVMKMVDKAVLGLDDLEKVARVLAALGKRHFKYYEGIEAIHFQLVGAALLETLEANLKDEWTADTRAAWEALYGAITLIMSKGFTEAKDNNPTA